MSAAKSNLTRNNRNHYYGIRFETWGQDKAYIRKQGYQADYEYELNVPKSTQTARYIVGN